MNQTPIGNGMLLALCGILDGTISVIYFSHAGEGFHAMSAVVFVGMLTAVLGACTIAAGFWSPGNGKHWLLVLNGLACCSLGLIFTFWTGPLAFRTIAALIMVMALSIGFYEWASARTLRRDHAAEWLLGAAGAASLGFALAFLAFVFRWIKLDPGSPGQSLRWLGSYFGFCAVCMVGLALRLYSQGLSGYGQRGALPTSGSPRHAH